MSNLKRCIMSHFEELQVWQKSVDLAVKVYEITSSGLIRKDFGLSDQMRRASVSIPSNISEGDQQDSDKSSTRYLKIAKGSAAELLTQSIIAKRISYFNDQEFEFLSKECKEIIGMLTNLIKHRST
jgi:four helix bundle protein